MKVLDAVRTAFGYVYDADSHQVLEGVTVTLTPKSIPQPQLLPADILVTTTDAQGYYQFTDVLAPGSQYIYSFQKGGYQLLEVDREIYNTTTGMEPRLDVELGKKQPFPWWMLVVGAAVGGVAVAVVKWGKSSS